MRFLAAEIDSVKGNLSLLRKNDSHDAPQSRGLACSVSTQEGDQFSPLYFRREPFEDMTFAIIGMDVLKKKHSTPPQIGLLNFLIVRDLRGSPFCQDTPLIQYRDDV